MKKYSFQGEKQGEPELTDITPQCHRQVIPSLRNGSRTEALDQDSTILSSLTSHLISIPLPDHHPTTFALCFEHTLQLLNVAPSMTPQQPCRLSADDIHLAPPLSCPAKLTTICPHRCPLALDPSRRGPTCSTPSHDPTTRHATSSLWLMGMMCSACTKTAEAALPPACPSSHRHVMVVLLEELCIEVARLPNWTL